MCVVLIFKYWCPNAYLILFVGKMSTFMEAMTRPPGHPDFVPLPGSREQGLSRVQSGWVDAREDGSIQWPGGMPPFRDLDQYCTVPIHCKGGKGSGKHENLKHTEFFKRLRDGDIVRVTDKQDGYSSLLSCAYAQESGGGPAGSRRPIILVRGRLNQQDPFQYDQMKWEGNFKTWAASVNPVLWAELVAYDADGGELGYECLGSVIAFLKRNPNPPDGSPYLRAKVFWFYKGDWTSKAAFLGDSIDLLSEEGLRKSLVHPAAPDIEVVKGKYFLVCVVSDGRIQFSNTDDPSERFDSVDDFVAAMDADVLARVREGYVLSKLRVLADCKNGSAWETDSFKTIRDPVFTIKRRPWEPVLSLLCVGFSTIHGSTRDRVYVLYGLDEDAYGSMTGLLKCGFLKVEVCAKNIRDALKALENVNEQSLSTDRQGRFRGKRFEDDYTRIGSRLVDFFVCRGYIVEVTPTWITWERHQLTGIKYVSEGRAVMGRDSVRTISNVRRVAESIPYMKKIHTNTAAVMRKISAGSDRSVEEPDSFGEVTRLAPFDLSPGPRKGWSPAYDRSGSLEKASPVSLSKRLGVPGGSRGRDVVDLTDSAAAGASATDLPVRSVHAALSPSSPAAATLTRVPLSASPPSPIMEDLRSPPKDRVLSKDPFVAQAAGARRKLPDWIANSVDDSPKRPRAAASQPSTPKMAVRDKVVASGGGAGAPVASPSPAGTQGSGQGAAAASPSPAGTRSPAASNAGQGIFGRVRQGIQYRNSASRSAVMGRASPGALPPGQFYARTIGLAPDNYESERVAWAALPSNMKESDYKKAHIVVSRRGSLSPLLGCLQHAIFTHSVNDAKKLLDMRTILGPSVTPPRPSVTSRPNPPPRAQPVVPPAPALPCQTGSGGAPGHSSHLIDEVPDSEPDSPPGGEVSLPHDARSTVKPCKSSVLLEEAPDSQPNSPEGEEAPRFKIMIPPTLPPALPPVQPSASVPGRIPDDDSDQEEIDRLCEPENRANRQAKEYQQRLEEERRDAADQDEARLRDIEKRNPSRAGKIRKLRKRFEREKEGFYFKHRGGGLTIYGEEIGDWVPEDETRPPRHDPPQCGPGGYSEPESSDGDSVFANMDCGKKPVDDKGSVLEWLSESGRKLDEFHRRTRTDSEAGGSSSECDEDSHVVRPPPPVHPMRESVLANSRKLDDFLSRFKDTTKKSD